MNVRIAALAAILASVSLPAFAADDINMAKIKCSDFLASSKDDIGTILVWLEGFYTKENDPPILHVDKMNNDAKALGTYCAQHGEDGIIKAADAVMPVK